MVGCLIDHDGPTKAPSTALGGEDSPHGLVVFTSGWGDGVYPSYWALDTSGIPVALVTDFLCIQGGDGRDEREIADQAYRDSLPPDEAEALARLVAAVERDDPCAARPVDAPQRANQIEPGCGTALYEAIRLDRPQALRVLPGWRATGDARAPAHEQGDRLFDYARFLKKPRSAELMAVLKHWPLPSPHRPHRRGAVWVRLFGAN